MESQASIPPGSALQRVTDEFTAETVPAGLRRAHRIAVGVWGRLRVRAGSVRFVLEEEADRSVLVEAGQDCVIEPGVLHHVEPSPDARFVVEFYRPTP
jgi:hemoglobin